MTEAAEILRKAKDLIETKGWTKGAFARDRNGLWCDATSRASQCLCSYGAILCSAGANRGGRDEAMNILTTAIEAQVVYWNDNIARDKEEVLSAFDRAIALAEKSDVQS